MRMAPFVVTLAARVSWGEPEHVPLGAWTMTRLDNRVLTVHRTRLSDDLMIVRRPVGRSRGVLTR